ncbi:MAG: hypothetical protein NC082_08480 [Clostridiales bacterium]|nr:hypothetical protein [Clostridiales bacterium]
MKSIRYILMPLLLLTLTFTAGASTDYATLQVKAGRFYHYKEWSSALAMYKLMLDQRPDIADTYTHAIIAASLDKKPYEITMLFKQSIDAHIPLDSIYNGVQRLAFEQGDAILYEDFLKGIAQEYPWMTRNIDSRLLDYYTWRRNGEGMVEYAHRMLRGIPDNTQFLTALADGYFTMGREKEAVEVYNRIVALDPLNYHALLVLGNYYIELSRQERSNEEAHVLAVQFLERANSLRPTPYVTSLINTLHQPK